MGLAEGGSEMEGVETAGWERFGEQPPACVLPVPFAGSQGRAVVQGALPRGCHLLGVRMADPWSEGAGWQHHGAGGCCEMGPTGRRAVPKSRSLETEQLLGLAGMCREGICAGCSSPGSAPLFCWVGFFFFFGSETHF